MSEAGPDGDVGQKGQLTRKSVPAVLSRHLPNPLQRSLRRLLRRWPGRILVNSIVNFTRLEMFDRSMTVAAQFFTSVLPILILVATWGANTDRLMNAVHMPEESRIALEDAVQGAGDGAFGLIGALVVLASATSLSRALTRAFAAVWGLPRPRNRLTSAWRWLTAVLALALSLIGVRAAGAVTEEAPLQEVWPLAVSLLFDGAIAVFVPWILLAGAVRPRALVPGAVLFAGVMVTLRPASAAWLPHALAVSADRYGSIGVAFTYLTWMYAVSLCFLTAAVVGEAIASDRGRLGAFIRSQKPGITRSV